MKALQIEKSIEKFSTERLIADRLRWEDLGELCRMDQDPIVMITLNGIRSEEETQQFLHNNLNHWQCHGYGLWMFRDKGKGRFVGRGGLRNVCVDGNDEIELAYALMAKYWGLGIATEMAEAILTIGFDFLNIKNVVCFTLTTNRASQRVMEKVGFQYQRDIIHANLQRDPQSTGCH